MSLLNPSAVLFNPKLDTQKQRLGLKLKHEQTHQQQVIHNKDMLRPRQPITRVFPTLYP